MNRFKKTEFPLLELDFEFIGVELLGECYRFRQKSYEIYFKNFDVLADLELHHYPNAPYKKRNSFEINNIEVHTNSFNFKLFPEEYETIYKKIVDSIRILHLNS